MRLDDGGSQVDQLDGFLLRHDRGFNTIIIEFKFCQVKIEIVLSGKSVHINKQLRQAFNATVMNTSTTKCSTYQLHCSFINPHISNWLLVHINKIKLRQPFNAIITNTSTTERNP